MPKLILFVAIVLLLFWWWRSFSQRDGAEKRSFALTSAAYLVAAIAIAAALTGRMHWIGAALAALLAGGKTLLAIGLRSAPIIGLLSRIRPLRPSFSTSRVRVTFDLGNSTLSGTLLEAAGELAGLDVKALTDEQYQELWQSWQSSDRQSALLLRACRLGAAQFGREQDTQAPSSSALSAEQAAQILGLTVGAPRKQIIAAHRRLMQRLHPDRGGSDYLAAQINEAKEILLALCDDAS